ncbi:leucine-rich repeat-containing protein 74A-like [Battus philenor]|uniref:leucine-rich repeat-containing protein 74A-like n=1 Tax=Battus philenor TaxID=42288 RepID=UPI0035CFF149
MTPEESESTLIIFEHEDEESSIDVPMSEWSSLINESPKENKKYALQAAGLYEPGSGEICAKYISMSASSVLRHPYYHYPAILDPGIEEAILEPEEKIQYPNDGQALYLAVCDEMNQCPVKTFYNMLLDKSINLKYYGVNPNGVRAMAIALQHNRTVTSLDFTDNFLNDDACFHLSQMLITNSVLQELNLTGCLIGISGVKRLMSSLPLNRSLQCLNLSNNKLGNEGMKYVSESIIHGLEVPRLILRNNEITGEAANFFTEALETFNKFTHLDFSWNKLFMYPQGIFHMLFELSESRHLEELSLAWNSLFGARTGIAIKSVMKTPKLSKLDLSNNRLFDEAITHIADGMHKAKNLVTLDLSYNPMSAEDAVNVIVKMKLPRVKIRNLLMENVTVNKKFLHNLDQLRKLKSGVVVNHGDIIGGFVLSEPDMRDIVLNRADFLTKKQKKRRIDIALLAMELLKYNHDIMLSKTFATAIVESGAPLNDELVNEIINTFAGPKTGKGKTIDLNQLVDFIKIKWPERKLPPTPPPEPEPEPIPIPEPEPEPVAASKKKSTKKKTK